MRILYIGSFRFPLFDAAASRVLNVARTLRLAGHDVSFISWGGAQRKEDLCDDGLWRFDGFPYVVTNELPHKGSSYIVRIRNRLLRGAVSKKLICEWPEPIDVIITYNNSLCKWLIPFCERSGIKLVNDITEWYAYNELNPTNRLSYAYDMHFRQKKVKNKIVISHFLDRFYCKTHNLVIPATCDPLEPKWHVSQDYVRDLLGSFDGITLIYAGNPAQKDLLHHFINAVQRLIIEGALIRFIILGMDRNSYMLKYGHVIHTNNLHDNIAFIGRVPQDMIPSFYRYADFMVLLRDNTRKSNAGFPTKFAESFISGTPVVANLTSDIGRYLIDGVTGFVVGSPNEEDAYLTLKNQVLTLSRKEIETMKRNVFEAAKPFDFNEYVEQLRKFISELR